MTRRADIAQLAELLGKVDPAGRSPDELPPLSLSDRKALASILIERINEIAAMRPANRPPDQERHFFAALEVALRPAKQTIEAAKEKVRPRWGFTYEQMRRAWLDHGKQAAEIASSQNRIGLLRVVEGRRERLCGK